MDFRLLRHIFVGHGCRCVSSTPSYGPWLLLLLWPVDRVLSKNTLNIPCKSSSAYSDMRHFRLMRTAFIIDVSRAEWAGRVIDPTHTEAIINKMKTISVLSPKMRLISTRPFLGIAADRIHHPIELLKREPKYGQRYKPSSV